jgi:hypothetical protein
VFGVTAASRNTRFQAVRYDLTWAGLAPADRASLAWRLPSFDHLVGESERDRRDFEAQRFGGHGVDDRFDLGVLLHWKIAGFLALEDAIDATPCRRLVSQPVRQRLQEAAESKVSMAV